MRRRWRSTVSICVVAVGCGIGPDVAVEPGQPPLPTLPPRTVDTGGAGTDGETESQVLRDARAGAAVDDWRQLAGFEGSQWTEDLRSQLTVLQDSLHVDDGVVYGLVRNEHPVSMGPITLHGNGTQIEPFIPILRPGEPAPFILSSDQGEVAGDASLLRATADEAASSPTRDMRITVYWTRGIDDPRPADTYLHEDPAKGPHPFVAFGTVEALRDVAGLRIVGAWLGRQGEVLRVAEGTVAEANLEEGDTTDFVISVHGPAALDDARLMLWATGS